jgi:hemolysin-activating ACP:hemolysin acyltransferase
MALGLAVDYLKDKPAFAAQPFGEWCRALVGQIKRGHYCFVVDSADQVLGYLGWGLTEQHKAEAWVEGRAPLRHEDCAEGDCVVFSIYAADAPAIQRFVFAETRKLIRGKRMVYFKRQYANGAMRPTRLAVNAFVARHVERAAAASSTSSSLHPENT